MRSPAADFDPLNRGAANMTRLVFPSIYLQMVLMRALPASAV